MEQNELNKTLAEHLAWRNMESGGKRANLRGADLDYSAWPLWCGSLNATGDDRLVRQLLYHTLRLAKNSDISEELRCALLTEQLVEQANQFHRVEECGKIKV